MRRLLAIDPGTTESAYVIWDGKKIHAFDKLTNHEMLVVLNVDTSLYDAVVIEQIKSYGMAVGESIFETVFWSGMFAGTSSYTGKPIDRMPRMDVKMHLCHSARAKDSNIMQALIDRFAPNTRNKGKGVKSDKGFFFGFRSDIWAAFALAAVFHDTKNLSRHKGE